MSANHGFSVRIFIPSGEPEGLRIVEKSNWTGQGLVFPRAQFADVKKRDGDDVIESLSKSQRKGWEWLSARQEATSSEYVSAMSVSSSTALNHLNHFLSLGLLEKTGSGPATQYRVVRR